MTRVLHSLAAGEGGYAPLAEMVPDTQKEVYPVVMDTICDKRFQDSFTDSD
jgi:hypothetical protein